MNHIRFSVVVPTIEGQVNEKRVIIRTHTRAKRMGVTPYLLIKIVKRVEIMRQRGVFYRGVVLCGVVVDFRHHLQSQQ
jgi:hypothetical protein